MTVQPFLRVPGRNIPSVLVRLVVAVEQTPTTTTNPHAAYVTRYPFICGRKTDELKKREREGAHPFNAKPARGTP